MEKELLTFCEVMDELGMSRSTLERMVKAGRIRPERNPYMDKPRVNFSPSEISRYKKDREAESRAVAA